MARQILGGPTDEGRASYQVAITTCRECNRGWQQGRGEQIEVASEIVEMVNCDAHELARSTTPPTWVKTRCFRPRAATKHPTRRASPSASVAMADGASSLAVETLPSSTSITSSALRRRPTTTPIPCHVVRAHHRAQHCGQPIEGRVSTGLVFRHADGSPTGSPADPSRPTPSPKLSARSRALGFRDARPAMRSRTQATNPPWVNGFQRSDSRRIGASYGREPAFAVRDHTPDATEQRIAEESGKTRPSAPVAQWIEQRFPKPKVVRSSRAGGAVHSACRKQQNADDDGHLDDKWRARDRLSNLTP